MKKRKIIKIKDISLSYHNMASETKAISKMSFNIYENEFLTIVGPSGCGKSTMLSIIAGLTKKSCGTIKILSSSDKNHSHPIGYMLQQDQLFPWRNIMQNVFLGLEIQKIKNKKAENYAKNLMKKYGIWDFAKHYPNELSGGMRQKAALIRTLATNPEILLLDEPFSALDYQTRLTISEEIREIIRRENKTAVLVTHDISEAINLSNRIVIFSGRPSSVKRIIDINKEFTLLPHSQKRKSTLFNEYFETVWSELNE